MSEHLWIVQEKSSHLQKARVLQWRIALVLSTNTDLSIGFWSILEKKLSSYTFCSQMNTTNTFWSLKTIVRYKNYVGYKQTGHMNSTLPPLCFQQLFQYTKTCSLNVSNRIVCKSATMLSKWTSENMSLPVHRNDI